MEKYTQKEEFKSLKIKKSLHKLLKTYCTENDQTIVDYIDKTLRYSIFEKKITELQKLYNIILVDQPTFEYDNKKYITSLYMTSIENICVINNNKKIFLYKYGLPDIWLTIIS